MSPGKRLKLQKELIAAHDRQAVKPAKKARGRCASWGREAAVKARLLGFSSNGPLGQFRLPNLNLFRLRFRR
jgi:hypothetical protein